MPGSMSGGMHMSASIQPTTAPRLSRIPRLKAEARPRVPTRRMTLTRGCRRFSASLQVWSGESSSTTMTSAESPRCRKTLWIVSTMFSRSLNVASTMETRGSGRLTGIWSALLMRVGSRPAAFQEFLDDLVGLLSRQAEARGEIEAAVPEVVGDGVFPVDIRVARIPVLEYRLPVHRAEEGARLDAFGLEILHDGISPLGEARAELDAEHPVDVLRSGRFEGNLEAFAEAEEREVPARDLSLSPTLLPRRPGRGEAERRLHVRQPVVEPHDAVDEPRRLESLVVQEAELRGERRVADEDHSPLPRRQDLVAVEAETPGVPEGPDLAAGDLRSMRLGTILDDGEVVPSRDFQDGRHVAGMAVHVHRHDRPRARRDLLLDLPRVEAPRLAVHVHEHGLRFREEDGVRRDDQGEVWNDDLVAGPDPESDKRQMERGRAARAGNRVRHPAPRGEGLLEARDVAPERGDPVGLEAVEHVPLLVAVQHRLPDGNHGGKTIVSESGLLRDAKEGEAERKAQAESGKRRLEPEEGAEERVDERGRRAHVGARLGLRARPLLAQPPQGGRREEEAHSIETLAESEARSLQERLDFGAAEAPVRPDGAVVLAGEPGEGRDLEDQEASRLEAPMRLPQRRLFFDAAVAEDIYRSDDPEGFSRKRQRTDRAGGESGKPPRPRQKESLQRSVQSDAQGRRSGPEGGEKASGPAPRVEPAPPRAGGRAPLERARDLPPQRDKPPVMVLDIEERPVFAGVHGGSCEL